ncbi:hypothetical protein WKR98_06220 [Pigmentiphaga sp. YJ18]|uniref:hypothetical protein n=1 Tax=Pigmentiphaga sp. YJ18 TaxID=3134907 RepID=UPI00310D7BD6
MNKTRTAAAAALLGLLAACGGGGDGEAPPVVNANAEGFWEGTSTAGDPVALLVTDEGKLWSFYLSSNQVTVLQGSGSTQGNNYTANGKAYGMSGPGSAMSLSATVEEKKALRGNVTGAKTFSFNADYSKEYEIKASLDEVKGTWVVEDGVTISTTIAASGNLVGYMAANSGRCDFSGSIAPHASKNYFRTSITFANNCAVGYAGVSTTGVALVGEGGADRSSLILATSVPADGAFMFTLVGERTPD